MAALPPNRLNSSGDRSDKRNTSQAHSVESLLRELLSPSRPGDDRPPRAVSGRVLIVDDDRGVREMFRRSLELAHFDVVVAAGGEEGLRILRADPAVCLVLLDLTMPGMDGRQFRDAQRRDPSLADIPTVIVTGSALAKIVHAELMAMDYLLKPVAREHLVSVVGRYCKPLT
jgi:CheY-like chemotaxis protein